SRMRSTSRGVSRCRASLRNTRRQRTDRPSAAGYPPRSRKLRHPSRSISLGIWRRIWRHRTTSGVCTATGDARALTPPSLRRMVARMERIGVVPFWKSYDRKTVLRTAELADDLGYDSIWVPEAWAYEQFQLLTEIAL